MDCYFHANVPSVARCTGCAQSDLRDVPRRNRHLPRMPPGRPDRRCGRDARRVAGRGRPAPRRSASALRRAAGRPPPRRRSRSPRLRPGPWSRSATRSGRSPRSRCSIRSGRPTCAAKRSRRSASTSACSRSGSSSRKSRTIPLLGISAIPILAVLAPVWLVASVLYGFKVWHGEEVRVPLVSDWLDEHAPDDRTTTA